MTVYILAFFVLLLVVTGMALGVIFSNKPIKGSCGGLNAIGIDGKCEICGGDSQKCEDQKEQSTQEKAENLFYDASK